MFEGMNYSFLPDIMASGGAATPPPALTTTPIATPQQPWYNNPGFWSMIGKFGSALSPKDSWGDRLGQAAALEGQARQYGAGMNKMLGPMLAGSVDVPIPGATGTELGTVAPTSSPATGAPTPSVNPFNNVPFSGGPSTPVLSQAELMGLSPDQIKDVMGTAVEAKKFPLEIDRVRSGIEYTKSSTEHMKKLNEEIDRKKKIEADLETSWNSWLTNAENPDNKTKLPAYLDESTIPLLKSLGREKSATIIDNLINLQKTTGKKYHLYFDGKSGKGVAVNPENPADRQEFDIPKTPETGAEKLPPAGYVNFAYNRALSNALPALEEHYVSTLGDKAKARQKMVQIQAMLGKDPNLAAGEIQALIASAPPALRDRIIADYNATLNSMIANQGQIVPGGEKPQGPQTQGAGATPGILMYRKPVPEQNKFMLEGLPKGEPTPFDDKLNQHFSANDIPMAKEAMKRESSGNPRAKNVNTNGTVDYGLFQINEVNVPELRKAGIINEVTDLYDVDVNIKAASYLQKKYGWKPWKSSLGSLAEGKTASLKVPAGTMGTTKDGKRVRMLPNGSVEYVK